MATQKQILANRANAARSTGPITPEGKIIASRNSTRHGMLADAVVLEGESKSRFEELHTALTSQLQPRSPTEATLVETMTVARWKQMRIWGIEKAGFELDMAHALSSAACPATRASIVFRRLADNSRVLDLQHRYETGYERRFFRAYAFLIKLRAKSDAPPDGPGLPPALSLLQFSSSSSTWEDPSEDAPEESPEAETVEPV